MRTASPVISSELLRRGHHSLPDRMCLPAWRGPRIMSHDFQPKRTAARTESRVTPGLKKAFDYFAYAVTGLVLAAGSIYGLRHLPQPAQAAREAAVAQPAPPDQTATQTADAIAPAPEAEAPPATVPQEPAAAYAADPQTDAVPAVTNADATAAAAAAQDQATFLALQRNCYEAADNNQNGEYPALQASACNRYAQFAYVRGWDAGPLPAFGQPAPQAQPAPVDSTAFAQPQPDQQPQVIILNQDYNGYHPVHEHRHDQPAGGGTPPQHQIGPNYPLPPPQPSPHPPHSGLVRSPAPQR